VNVLGARRQGGTGSLRRTDRAGEIRRLHAVRPYTTVSLLLFVFNIEAVWQPLFEGIAVRTEDRRPDRVT
jgi:hypothetical protein